MLGLRHGTSLGLTMMWEAIFCLQDEFIEWHKKECLMGECDLSLLEFLIFLIENFGQKDPFWISIKKTS
jgi:hypothetical protein